MPSDKSSVMRLHNSSSLSRIKIGLSADAKLTRASPRPPCCCDIITTDMGVAYPEGSLPAGVLTGLLRFGSGFFGCSVVGGALSTVTNVPGGDFFCDWIGLIS
jgi:hypothetical protein